MWYKQVDIVYNCFSTKVMTTKWNLLSYLPAWNEAYFFFLSLKASTEKLTVEEKAYSTLMQNVVIHYFCWSLHPMKKYSCIILSLACFPVKRMSAFSLEWQKNAKTRYWLLIMDVSSCECIYLAPVVS